MRDFTKITIIIIILLFLKKKNFKDPVHNDIYMKNFEVTLLIYSKSFLFIYLINFTIFGKHKCPKINMSHTMMVVKRK